MAHLEEMPLFPLQAVLFPYSSLQLHVFEERYREMVRHCVEYDTPFGIVLIRSGSEVGDTPDPYLVGTAVRVQSVHTYQDGRMDLRVKGERRFRVRKLDDSRPYLVGFVEPVVELDVDENPRTNALVMRAREVFRMLIEGSFSRSEVSVQVFFPPDPTALSFVIASFLQIDDSTKQKLLETTDTADRLSELIPLIERQIVEAKSPRFAKLDPTQLSDWISPN